MAMKILLAVDGSDFTKRMLAYVAAHEEMFGPDHDYIVFTAIPPTPAVTREVAEADAILNPVRAFAGQNGWRVRALHLAGDPAQAIAALADREHPDLIVMGSHGHTALGNLALGSVATGVLARCKVPVLLIR
jgi:nucleotide-binding universal stress UspA family protein